MEEITKQELREIIAEVKYSDMHHDAKKYVMNLLHMQMISKEGQEKEKNIGDTEGKK